jgi:hypothetical protein
VKWFLAFEQERVEDRELSSSVRHYVWAISFISAAAGIIASWLLLEHTIVLTEHWWIGIRISVLVIAHLSIFMLSYTGVLAFISTYYPQGLNALPNMGNCPDFLIAIFVFMPLSLGNIIGAFLLSV